MCWWDVKAFYKLADGVWMCVTAMGHRQSDLNSMCFALQKVALGCAMAMADVPWTWMGGTVSASWAGEELAATHPWRPPVVTAKTMMEVRLRHPWALCNSGVGRDSGWSVGIITGLTGHQYTIWLLKEACRTGIKLYMCSGWTHITSCSIWIN